MMDVEQQANDVRLDADRRTLDYENYIDDEEVTLLRHKRDTDVTDIPGSDICDGLDTQREDWLLQTESLHGARPRRITRERPPLIDDHIRGLWTWRPREVQEAGRWSIMDSRLLCCHPSNRY